VVGVGEVLHLPVGTCYHQVRVTDILALGDYVAGQQVASHVGNPRVKLTVS
jgi:uncharacterized protein YjlB